MKQISWLPLHEKALKDSQANAGQLQTSKWGFLRSNWRLCPVWIQISSGRQLVRFWSMWRRSKPRAARLYLMMMGKYGWYGFRSFTFKDVIPVMILVLLILPFPCLLCQDITFKSIPDMNYSRASPISLWVHCLRLKEWLRDTFYV